MEKLRILVLEDNEKHIKDAQEFFLVQKNVELVILTKSYEAMEIIGSTRSYANANFFTHEVNVVDGIISDIFMPEFDGRCEGLETPQGVNVFLVALLRGIPLVFCTDRHHHGSLQWLDTLRRDVLDSLNIPISESGDITGGGVAIKETKGIRKNWGSAYQQLLLLIDKKQEMLRSHFRFLNGRCAFMLKELAKTSAVGIKTDDFTTKEYLKNRAWANEERSKLNEQISILDNIFK